MSSTDDFLFRDDLATLDPAVAQLIELEKERQARKLIMVPSESIAPLAVREAAGSVLMNLYAEGYPNPDTHWMTEEEILDYGRYLAFFRRYGDRRFYRGTEYADVIESLARRRCAEAFATETVPVDQIYVNVQPLSGAPANAAAMQALLQPGDTIMAMALPHGGHLTHGSPANLSGKLYRVVCYHVSERTELLDYDEVEALALEHKPRLIIAGYTSYPWQPDWARFRQIADQVGAYLLADIAHVAGMVVAGAYRTPVGHAHVVSLTTHKTLCGPRAACILTADARLAQKIDRAVFPGLQGGPHVNKFAAMAVAFQIARTEQFRHLQHQIVANAAALAKAFQARGLRVPCGGTDTHLLLLDCKTIRSRDGIPLMGEVLATILDMIGIVVNRNPIPGDRSNVHPSGVRFGTPWVTQRGLREPEMGRIADIVARAMQAIEPFTYSDVRGPVYRGKIDFDVLEQLRAEVAELAVQAGVDFEPPRHSRPNHYPLVEAPRESRYDLIEIEGRLAADFVECLTSADLADLAVGEWRAVALLERDGRVLSNGLVQRPGPGFERYRLVVPGERSRRVLAWLRALSDGYARFDDGDLWAKLPGPVVVRDREPVDETSEVLEDFRSLEEELPPCPSPKPYFVGLASPHCAEPAGEPLPLFAPSAARSQAEERPLRRTPLHDWHAQHGARMAPFAGWEMPLWYTSIGDEHRAVREAAGLFDVAHMGLVEVKGPHAAYFLNLATTNDVHALRPGKSQYSYVLAPDGTVLDDVMVYMLAPERYLLVANAANAEKDWAWLQAVNARAVRIDYQRPWAHATFQAELVNLHDPEDGGPGWGDLALQGPRAPDMLLALLDAAPSDVRARLLALKRTEVMEAHIPSSHAPGGAFDLIVARTGYTGEPRGYEMFISAEAMAALWEQLMEAGAPLGLRPIGLGARDSLRIEAGLPLYGHELAGPLELRPADAGFAGYVKLHKPFFVGRRATIEHAQQRKMVVVRFHIGRKGVRIPKLEDVVVDNHGRVMGQVTSCAMGKEGHLVGQAYIDERHATVGSEINIFPHPAREDWDKPYEELEIGDRLVLHSEATVVERFMRQEKRG
jgi:glycine hydroxymethyltransferase